ncbi:MAG: lipopolysaccharide biosynthesis protein [Candidatus Limnocylindrales bacterium]
MSGDRIARDTAAIFAGRIVAQLLLVVATVLLAAHLGLDAFGRYAVIAGVILLANVVTTFGTDMLLIREMASGRRSIQPADVLFVQLVLSVPAIVAIAIAAPLIGGGDPGATAALRIGSWSLLPAAAFSVATAALRGAGRAGRYAVVGILAAVIQLGAILAFAPAGVRIETLGWLLLGGGLASAAVAWLAAATVVPGFTLERRPTLATVGATARASAPIGGLAIAGMAYQRAALLGVALAAGPAAAGWFAAGARILDASKTGHQALYTALYPLHAAGRERSAGPERTAGLVSGAGAIAVARRRSVVVAGAIAVGLLVAGPALVDRLFGSAFAPAATGLAVLAVSLVPSAVASHRTIELLAVGAERPIGVALVASLATLVVLLIALVPRIGWLGGAWAVVAAECVDAWLLVRARPSGLNVTHGVAAADRRWSKEGAGELPEPAR